MAVKKEYVCARAMTDNGRDYERGDTIEMAEAEAAQLVGMGALKEKVDPTPKPEPKKPAKAS